jgi:protein-tyrosine-phosphatase/predicted ATP-grasp superfamily ATP-dependent carboligase/CelD/BcsL family acetyltransferase involved in cellulose biosynthesis
VRRGKVLVLGDDTRSFLATVRSLGRQQIEVHAAPVNFLSPALKSRYITRIHFLPFWMDDGAEWLEAMEALLRAERFDLVIPCNETTLLPLQFYRERFGALTKLAIPDDRSIAALFDKHNTRELAHSLGIRISPGRLVREGDTAEAVLAEFGAPVVVKPRQSYAMGEFQARGKVHVVADVDKLRELLTHIHPDDSLYEQYFPGRGLGVSLLASRGRVLQAFEHHRVRESSGSAYYRVSAPLSPPLLQACTDIVAALDYTGVGMFEFKLNEDTGDWVLLEVNARPWGSMPLPLGLGIDFPYRWYRLLVDGEETPAVTYRIGVFGRNLVPDLRIILSEAKELRSRPLHLAHFVLGRVLEFTRVLTGREIHDVFVYDDPAPGLNELRELIGSIGDRLGCAIRGGRWLARVRGRWLVRRALCRGRDRPVSILFVCQGNICRSPFAAAVLKARLPARLRVIGVGSAGMLPRPGRPSPAFGRKAAEARGFSLDKHRSMHLSPELAEAATVIVVFDDINRQAVWQRYPHISAPVVKLGHFDPAASGDGDIPDPIDGDQAFYNSTYDAIEASVTGLARMLDATLQDTPVGASVTSAAAKAERIARVAQLSVSLVPIGEMADIAGLWRDLEGRSDAAFFLTWDWIGCWLRETGTSPYVLVGRDQGKIVALALVQPARLRRHGLLDVDALMFHQVGDPNIDVISIEHNGILVDRAYGLAATEACIDFLTRSKIGDTGKDWDELHFGGLPVSAEFRSLTDRAGLMTWHFSYKPSWVVDLSAVRETGGSYLDSLSANTRYQIRRSTRIYEKRGPLTAVAARDLDEAMTFFDEMKDLHQRYWVGRGYPGSFAYPFFERFHRALIAVGLPKGTVELVRVAAGDSVIGYVYNFKYNGWVCAYLTGFVYEPDPKLKPGLVSHRLCIERHLQQGDRYYDFLAGGERYKANLAGSGPDVAHCVLQRPILKLRAESALRRLKGNVSGFRRMARWAPA